VLGLPRGFHPNKDHDTTNSSKQQGQLLDGEDEAQLEGADGAG
jgi:hypothetical protein